MSFLKNIFNKIPFPNAPNLICGIGESEIGHREILISEYPFEPSIAFPNRRIKADEIDWVCYISGPAKIKVDKDLIFISTELKNELKKFAQRNKIKIQEHSWNWEWILDPYLDTTLTAEEEKRLLKNLSENGLEKAEVERIRNEVGQQMLKYNFDTMLWEWCSLGLYDVLSAMRAKYDEEKFREFYVRAIEIEQRGKNKTNN
ncbi:hypothetical protein OOZ15_03905 [Galbibacter sp. EGI 63066]|uniref:hypothetical protein n=1 Tax=Galbibacter sp. EGI 63066 TaxID=2993559 RepID=UPI002248CEEA|nr:hypothetical protein [Galbibacter sp. EGI 63066]MCX2679076.1 hypothetical protein [Galbibacter sp. EGI 63066]